LETLTPIQRIAVIAICLALTALIAMLLAPWVWNQVSERLIATSTPTPGTSFLPSLSAGRPLFASALIQIHKVDKPELF
jgi:hypothetical protein